MPNNQIIGPYFFGDETINRYNYRQMSENYFYPIMQRKRLNVKMIFEQDVPSSHFFKEVRT